MTKNGIENEQYFAHKRMESSISHMDLLMEYELKGIGFYWVCAEELEARTEENYRIEKNKLLNILNFKYKLDKKIAEEMLNFAIETGSLNEKNGHIFSPNIETHKQKRKEERVKKSNKGKEMAAARWGKNKTATGENNETAVESEECFNDTTSNAQEMHKHSASNASVMQKEKKKKEKKKEKKKQNEKTKLEQFRKIKKEDGPPPPPFFSKTLKNNGITQEAKNNRKKKLLMQLEQMEQKDSLQDNDNPALYSEIYRYICSLRGLPKLDGRNSRSKEDFLRFLREVEVSEYGFKDQQIGEKLKEIINHAMEDSFHENNLTSMSYLANNWVKIVKNQKKDKGRNYVKATAYAPA